MLIKACISLHRKADGADTKITFYHTTYSGLSSATLLGCRTGQHNKDVASSEHQRIMGVIADFAFTMKTISDLITAGLG